MNAFSIEARLAQKSNASVCWSRSVPSPLLLFPLSLSRFHVPPSCPFTYLPQAPSYLFPSSLAIRALSFSLSFFPFSLSVCSLTTFFFSIHLFRLLSLISTLLASLPSAARIVFLFGRIGLLLLCSSFDLPFVRLSVPEWMDG